MLLKIAQALAGRVRFQVYGGQGERFFSACMKAEIPLYDITPTETGYSAEVSLRLYPRLHTLARKQRCRLRMTQKKGAYVALWTYRKRWGILAGALLAAVLLLACSRLIWTVQFYDFTLAQQMILRRQLYEKNICEGSMVSTAQLKQAQNQLFVENKIYGWVKLNFVQGRLIVEKGDARLEAPFMPQEGVYDVVALCDGQIEHIEVSAGYRQRIEGQYVAQGEVIVGGAFTSAKGTQFTAHAQAKVYATVRRTYEAVQPLQGLATVPSKESKSFYTLWFANQEIPLGRQEIASAQTQETVFKRPYRLFGIPMPVTIEETRQRETEQISYTRTPQQATDIARAQIYDQLKADLPELVLQEAKETVTEENGAIVLRMEIKATANIAKVQPAQATPPPATGEADKEAAEGA